MNKKGVKPREKTSGRETLLAEFLGILDKRP